MSRGQKRRVPENFPRMRDRSYDRRMVVALGVDGPHGAETYTIFWIRRDRVPKGSILVGNPFFGRRR
jgi:hypothetical protein